MVGGAVLKCPHSCLGCGHRFRDQQVNERQRGETRNARREKETNGENGCVWSGMRVGKGDLAEEANVVHI